MRVPPRWCSGVGVALQGLFRIEARSLCFPTSMIVKVKEGWWLLTLQGMFGNVRTFLTVTPGLRGGVCVGGGGCMHYWLLTGRDQQCCYCTSSCPRQATPSTAPQKEPPDPAGQQCWDCEDLPPDINKSLALSCIWKDLTLGRPRLLTAIPAVNCQWPVFPAAEE